MVLKKRAAMPLVGYTRLFLSCHGFLFFSVLLKLDGHFAYILPDRKMANINQNPIRAATL